MTVQEMRLDQIKPYKNNPRKNDEAVSAVAASIREFGFKQPIVVDADGVIIVGHTRYKAAQSLGLETVPVLVASDLSDEQAKAYRLADNKTNELAEWDFQLLSEELEGLNIDMEQFGFEFPDVFDEAEITEDETPEQPAEPKAKRGDIYKLGRHRLMCGDSTVLTDVQKLMGGKQAHMVFTDPPWNVNYGADDNNGSYRPRQIINDSMDTEDFKDFMNGAFLCMNDAIKDGAMVYVVMSAQEWGNLMLTLSDNGFHWSSTIIWNKDRLVLSRKDYHTKYEPIWYGWKEGEARLCPLLDRKQSDVWDFERPSRSDEHPTMKPVALVAKAIKNSSHKGNLVLDLFGGSGTTLIACEETDRDCCMMELDPKYVDVIITRWENMTGEKAVLLDDSGSDA
jgi:DNA modification methylase